MNCSDKNQTLPFAVFTNTPQDYRITVCSEGIDEETKNLLDQIARRCPEGAPSPFVGVVPLLDRQGVFLAFRTFDVGPYRGRSHTLGLVAIVVPRSDEREWSFSQLLAALPAPVPGSKDYEMPDLRSLQGGEALKSEPFRSMEKWDRAKGAGRASAPEVFGPPGRPPPDFGGLTCRTTHRWWSIRAMLWGLGALLAAVCVVGGCILFLKQKGGETPVQPVEEAVPIEKRKAEIQQAFLDSRILSQLPSRRPEQLIRGLDLEDLQALAAAAAREVKKRLAGLREKFRKVPSSSTMGEGDKQVLLKKRVREALTAWRTDNLDVAPPFTADTLGKPNGREVERAIAVLRQHGSIVEEMEDLLQLTDTMDLKRRLTSLKDDLNAVVENQNAK